MSYEFTQGSNVDDVDYITQLAVFYKLQKTLVLKILLTGMSNGAELCYLFACESPGLFKAFAPVAGTIFLMALRIIVVMVYGFNI